MSDQKYSIKDPGVVSRMTEVLDIFDSFLSYAREHNGVARFLHGKGLNVTQQNILMSLVHRVSGVLFVHTLGETKGNDQSFFLTWWSQILAVPVDRLSVQQFTSTEAEALTSVAKMLLERFVKSAKPSTRFAYIRIDANTKQDSRCTVSPVAMIEESGMTKSLSKKLDPILGDAITKETVKKMAFLSKMCSNFSPVMGSEDESLFTSLQTYVDAWNAGEFPMKICGLELKLEERQNHMCPNYHVASGKSVMHFDRRPEHYILDGQHVYPYEVFHEQMKIDMFKAAWDKPESQITPANCHLISEGQMQVLDVTDIVKPEETNIVVLQFRKGDKQDVYESKLVFYRHINGFYKVIKPNDPSVKNAVSRIKLAKQLTR